LPTDYGACYSARRRWDVDGLCWHRITQFIMPFFSMIAASDPNIVSARAWVPLDDSYNLQIMMRGRLDRAVTHQQRDHTRTPCPRAHAPWHQPATRARATTRRPTPTMTIWSLAGWPAKS